MNSITINYHIIETCNAHCEYCFATFPDIKKGNRLSFDEQMSLVDIFARSPKVGKINFAGGEPTLVRQLGELCRRIKTVSDNRCTVSIVTNGKNLRPLIENHYKCIDIVALSIDSADDNINVDLGRTRPGYCYAPKILELGRLVKSKGIRLKLNTVVNRRNIKENLSDFVQELAPERWKMFQVLPVDGENNSSIEKLKISTNEFQMFVQRHRQVESVGVKIIPEENDQMYNSYLMVSPDGRFFWHDSSSSDKRYGPRMKFGPPILEVGLDEAQCSVDFSELKFIERGGAYN